MNDHNSPTATLDVALIGAGKVGTAVASLLARRGHRIAAVSSRSQASAQRAADLFGAPVADPQDWPRCDVVLLGVPEEAIAAVAERVGRADTTVIHFAGASGVAPLDPAASKGAQVAALHPVQACPTIEAGIRRLPGSAWGVTCSDDLAGWAFEFISHELDGRPVRVPEDVRPIWHAAAVTTSNGIAALLAAGEAMLEAEGITGPGEVLGPIAAGTVANVLEQGGGAAALTGPVVRGEWDTIARHMAALKERAPELLVQYRLAAQLMFATASSSGRLDLEQRLRISALLEDT